MPNVSLTFEDREPDTFTVQRAQVVEVMSTPFQLSVVVLCDDDDLDLDALTGARASLALSSGHLSRRFEGVCDQAECLHAVSTGASTYALSIVHDLAVLRHRTNHRIFQGASTQEIVTAILGEWDIEGSWVLEDAHPRFDVRTQYGESDLQFVTRLLEDDGITFAFRDESGTARLVFTDSPERAERSGEPIAFLDQGGAFGSGRAASNLRRTAELSPGSLVFHDFDFRRPSFPLVSQVLGEERERRRELHAFRPGGSAVRVPSALSLIHI